MSAGRRRGAGPVREKLADMLREELVRMGVSFRYFGGDDLLPVAGYWKSQDVYRWESVGLTFLHPDTGSEMHMSICGWEAMSKIVRAKRLVIDKAERSVLGQYEAWANPTEQTDAELLADANSHYSQAQLDEIPRPIPTDGDTL